MSTQHSTPALECIEQNPTPQSVYLDGVCINQSGLSRITGIDQGYLSKVLSGKHVPSFYMAETIANALGFSMERLAGALRARKSGMSSTELNAAPTDPIVMPKAYQRLIDRSRSRKA
jgi:transcriptional regulator with XRE-family HTH domain